LEEPSTFFEKGRNNFHEGMLEVERENRNVKEDDSRGTDGGVRVEENRNFAKESFTD